MLNFVEKAKIMSEHEFAYDIQAWANKYGSENAVAHLIDILNEVLDFDDRGRVACELWDYEF